MLLSLFNRPAGDLNRSTGSLAPVQRPSGLPDRPACGSGFVDGPAGSPTVGPTDGLDLQGVRI